METPATVPDVVVWVGLDWADQRHEIRLQAVGSPEVQSFTVERKPETLHAGVAELRARFPQGKIAGTSRKKSLWARAYYERKRQEGNDHHAAIRSLAFKWRRILYRCWKDRTPTMRIAI